MTDYERGFTEAIEKAAEARRYAAMYKEGSDGRNTFIIFADVLDGHRALSPPTDTVRVPVEGAVERMAKAIYKTKGHCYLDEDRMFVSIPWSDRAGTRNDG